MWPALIAGSTRPPALPWIRPIPRPIETYFETTGFERWNRFYSTSDDVYKQNHPGLRPPCAAASTRPPFYFSRLLAFERA
jgi:hypothetical protein